MSSRFVRAVKALDLEEQILNGAAIIGLIGLFLPWLSGEWLGEQVTHTAFGSFISFLGWAIFFLLAFILILTAVPLLGGPVLVRKRYKDYVHAFVAAQAGILTLAALSVLTKVTLEFSRVEVRFGINVTLIGSLVTLFYCFLRLQEHRKSLGQELFHHPDAPHPEERKETMLTPPPPPPPPPPPVEEHPLYP